jgi:hypothetical protein
LTWSDLHAGVTNCTRGATSGIRRRVSGLRRLAEHAARTPARPRAHPCNRRFALHAAGLVAIRITAGQLVAAVVHFMSPVLARPRI